MKLADFDFRIWDNTGKRFLYAGEALIRIGISQDSKQAFVTEFNPTFGDEEIKNCELELWTGLKDKNGTKVYDNDIINLSIKESGDQIVLVKFDVEYFHAFMVLRKNQEIRDVDYSPHTLWEYIYFGTHEKNENGVIEVVGNIHENKELLDFMEEAQIALKELEGLRVDTFKPNKAFCDLQKKISRELDKKLKKLLRKVGK